MKLSQFNYIKKPLTVKLLIGALIGQVMLIDYLRAINQKLLEYRKACVHFSIYSFF